jgi:peptidoglycan/LPS O-acetylase OafA/YrhL
MVASKDHELLSDALVGSYFVLADVCIQRCHCRWLAHCHFKRNHVSHIDPSMGPHACRSLVRNSISRSSIVCVFFHHANNSSLNLFLWSTTFRNAPTWFLSSMTFSTAFLPFCLPKIAAMDKRSLRRTSGWLFLVNLLPVLGYVYDHNTFSLVEGITAPKNHPALMVFNAQRFLPVFNVAEILMGAVACRLAMLDGLDDKEKTPKASWLSTFVPFAGLVGILALRGADLVPACSDLLVRSVLFTPLFLRFLMGAHRNAVAGINDPISRILSSKALVWLGGLSFPIYIVHGPLGQVFYKRLIAGKLWGGVLMGPQYFALYIASVLVSAFLLQVLFLQNKSVGAWSEKKVEQLSSWM